jgi:hypothetical protein
MFLEQKALKIEIEIEKLLNDSDTFNDPVKLKKLNKLWDNANDLWKNISNRGKYQWRRKSKSTGTHAKNAAPRTQ